MSTDPSERAPAGTGGRGSGGSMSLLFDLMHDTLDPGYAAAHATGRERASTPVRRLRLVVGLGLVGLLLTVAAVQAQRSAPAAAAQRSALVTDVRRLTAQTDALARQVSALQAATTAERQAVLGLTASGQRLTAQAAALAVAAGATQVTGPGLEVVLTDAAGSASGGAILDTDVQQVVNALWAAGARAVAVDGERVTTQTAIREAGAAILVDFRPVSSPYRVDAVGDPVALETAFGASTTAARYRTYAQLYGIGFGYHRLDRLDLPAATMDVVRFARALGEGPP